MYDLETLVNTTSMLMSPLLACIMGLFLSLIGEAFAEADNKLYNPKSTFHMAAAYFLSFSGLYVILIFITSAMINMLLNQQR